METKQTVEEHFKNGYINYTNEEYLKEVSYKIKELINLLDLDYCDSVSLHKTVHSLIMPNYNDGTLWGWTPGSYSMHRIIENWEYPNTIPTPEL